MLTEGDELQGKTTKSVEQLRGELQLAAKDAIVLIVLDGWSMFD